SHLGDLGLPERVGAPVSAQRIDAIALLFEQVREVERTRGVAALVGSPVTGLGGCLVALLFVQHTEIGSRAGVTKPVGSPIGRNRPGLITMLQQERVPERSLAVAWWLVESSYRVAGLGLVGDACRVGSVGLVGDASCVGSVGLV